MSCSFRAHLHIATKSHRIVDEVSAKDFSSPAKFLFAEKLRRRRIFNFILIFSAKLIFLYFLRLVDMLSQKIKGDRTISPAVWSVFRSYYYADTLY